MQNHWTEEQCTTGEWGYHTGGSRNGRPSMTVAGLASLFVTHDYLDAPTFGASVGRAPFSPALARGLNTYAGQVVNEPVAITHHLPLKPIAQVLAEN